MTITTAAGPGSRAAATPGPTLLAGRISRVLRSERGALAALLLGTALLYLWGLGASGYANEFYAAAVQAGTKSWKAMFFGSFDSANFITVDKPPAALWPMELSGRLFGFNSWTMLAPQAIEGVLSVWLLYATVRRWFGSRVALLSGVLLALTPVAVLMFRFNNPDALMTLLLIAVAYCVTRAIESASTRWLVSAGVVLGFAFLAKGLQPFTVLPAFTVAYLVAAPTPLRRRIVQLASAGVGVLAGAGWWLAAVALTPAADRPYIGGSGDNTALGLAFGYNGISRLTGGNGGGGGGGGGGGANFSGVTGIGRLFNSLNGGQIGWLLPAALAGTVVLLWLTRSAPRTDRTRAAAILFGGWLLVTGAVLSFAGGIIHTYYSVELAPAVATLTALGAAALWQRRRHAAARFALAAGSVVSAWWAYTLLHRTPSWQPWIGVLVLVLGVLAAVGLIVLGATRAPGRALAGLVAAVALLGLAAGPAAYAVQTAGTAHSGGIPSAGPALSGGLRGPGRFGGFAGVGGRAALGGAPSGFEPGRGAPPDSVLPGRQPPGAPAGAFAPPAGAAPGAGSGGAPGAAQQASAALTALLKATNTKWAAATVGSQSAAPLELASGKAVMAIGGFNGTDATPTLAQFKAFVAAGEIGYFVATGQGAGRGPGGQGTGSAISSWVAAHFSATTVGGSTVYDLTTAATP
jgi:4-amino-4-deoxy-L-arabinose transferase-like glycosyltransferase